MLPQAIFCAFSHGKARSNICNECSVYTLHQASLFSSAEERLRRKQGKRGSLRGGRKPAQLVVYPLFYASLGATRRRSTAHRRMRNNKGDGQPTLPRWFSTSFGTSAFLWLTPDLRSKKIRAVKRCRKTPPHSCSICNKCSVYTLHQASLFRAQESASGAKQGGQGEHEGDEETAQLVPHPPRVTHPSAQRADAVQRRIHLRSFNLRPWHVQSHQSAFTPSAIFARLNLIFLTPLPR